MDYTVGQILYMTSLKSLRIIPVQVVEEVSRTTLKGKETSYIVQLPDKEKTRFNVNSLKTPLYSDIVELEKTMIDNAKTSIKKMVVLAKDLATSEFPKQVEFENDIKEDNINNDKGVQVNNNDDIILVDLGNGVKAKMKKNELEKVNG